MPGICGELAELLGTVQRPGDFYASGRVEVLAPRLEVEGVGEVALPLPAVQAEQPTAIADRAPYGRGAETIPVDQWGRRQHVTAGGGVVAGLVRMAEAIDAALAERLTEHLLAGPGSYSLDRALAPAVKRLLESGARKSGAALKRFHAACLAHLAVRAAEPLEAPKDWTRASNALLVRALQGHRPLAGEPRHRDLDGCSRRPSKRAAMWHERSRRLMPISMLTPTVAAGPTA